MNLTDELDLCYNGNILSNKDKLLKIVMLLEVEAKTCNEIPNKYCNMEDREMEGRQLMRAKNIFREFSEKNTYLVCLYNQTLQKHNGV